MQANPARLFQGFEAERRGGNFGLLICGFAEIGAECTPEPLIAE